MRFKQPSIRQYRPSRRRRSGAIFVWCALLLPALIAMVGLVIDGGLMLATYREAQNAADAAALAAAMDLMLGESNATATATATTYVTDPAYNDLADATVVVNIPPSQGLYAGKAKYVEAIVTRPLTPHFIYVIPGLNRNQSVTARAVAGIEPIAIGAGVMALSPTGTGLNLTNNTQLTVQGRILVNSTDPGHAASAGTGGVWATDVEVAGNVDNLQNFKNVDGSGSNVVHSGAKPTPDVFGYLSTPTVANGVDPTKRTVTTNMLPGIYVGGISFSGNNTYTMAPGIYVLAGGGLKITGSPVVIGKGVMFYNTGANYDANTGEPDSGDLPDSLNQSPPTTDKTFGGATMNQQMTLSPIDTENKTYNYPNQAISEYNGMLFYQRRANTQRISIEGNTGGANLSGTIYAKWAELKYAGSGTTGAQFVVNTMTMSGGSTVTVNYTGGTTGRAPQVYLVE